MKDFQQRVIDEAKELSDRLIKLIRFLDTDASADISVQDRNLLEEQADAMNIYLNVLDKRIVLWGLKR